MSYYRARSKITRPFKGNNTLKLTDNYTVIDIETSNNGRLYGEIVEISAIKVRDNQMVETFDTLLKPTMPIDPFTQRIHNITNKMVMNAPKIEEMYPKLLRFIQNDILVGHNVHFDINFLYDYHQELNQPPLSNDFIDTLRLARRTLLNVKSYKLTDLSQFFGYSATTHRALEDCENTHLVYQALKNRLTEEEIEHLATIKAGSSTSSRNSLFGITPQTTSYNKSNYFYQKKVAFSGRLKGISRKQAAQLIVNCRGIVYEEIRPEVDILILGAHHHYSKKHQMAMEYNLQIMDQEEFEKRLSQ